MLRESWPLVRLATVAVGAAHTLAVAAVAVVLRVPVRMWLLMAVGTLRRTGRMPWVSLPTALAATAAAVAVVGSLAAQVAAVVTLAEVAMFKSPAAV